tara:strand:+ start:683 stop:2089 length:1407 start_codon:yes stop_codon:yes gene_type:complete
MPAVSIDQKPLYRTLPIGQQLMFSVSNSTIVATMYKVKFVAEVRVSNSAGINPNSPTDLIGTFKTTPNNKGVGIFDLRPILETFVSPDNVPSTATNSTYKGIPSDITTFPIHLVDKYSLSDKSIKFFAVRFLVEYAIDPTGSVVTPTDEADSSEYTMFNGVLQYDDVLTKSLFSHNYGYNLQNFELTDSDSKFLSNAPTTQYARLTDYGTLPFLNYIPLSSTPSSSVDVDWITVQYYNSLGVGIGSDTILNTDSTGGAASPGAANTRLNYFGAFPGNLQNWSSNFAAAVAADLSYYTVQAKNPAKSQLYTINILCPNERGYEGIRLTWLNQWGSWDYYTFNMKSTKSIKTKRTSYTQLEGTWNESTFQIADYKGGKKNFRVNSTEKIKLNTDFVSEAEAVWFEELINSTEVYIVKGFSTDTSNTITNKYIEPVTLKTSSYVRKSKANDRLIQYTFEVEKTRMKRTQSV